MTVVCVREGNQRVGPWWGRSDWYSDLSSHPQDWGSYQKRKSGFSAGAIQGNNIRPVYVNQYHLAFKARTRFTNNSSKLSLWNSDLFHKPKCISIHVHKGLYIPDADQIFFPPHLCYANELKEWLQT